MLCKMREDVSLLQIKGEISRFPHFVYAWFDQNVGGTQKLSSAELASNQALADEDRWGLYYGVKAMAKDDAEAQVGLIFFIVLPHPKLVTSTNALPHSIHSTAVSPPSLFAQLLFSLPLNTSCHRFLSPRHRIAHLSLTLLFPLPGVLGFAGRGPR